MKSMKNNFAWQCKCGHIEYHEILPDDCPKCYRVRSFSKLPEDMLEEAAAEEILSSSKGGDDYEEEEEYYED